MNVVSLFDGISCARVALDRASIPVKSYTAFEIDKYATIVSTANHPEIEHRGDVRTLLEPIPCDILIGGSPCQDLSIVKKDRKGLAGDRSGLFWEYVRIKTLLNPKWFILENVASMRKEDRDTITEALGVEPIMIDAALVSAQRRKRYFWTNIHTTLPQDKGILLKDILQTEVPDKYYMKKPLSEFNQKPGLYEDTFVIGHMIGRRVKDGKRCDKDTSIPMEQRLEPSPDQTKTGTLTHVLKDNLIIENPRVRRLTPIECERLQCLPDNYTNYVSDTQRYKCLGNAFNVDIVAHILSGLKA